MTDQTAVPQTLLVPDKIMAVNHAHEEKNDWIWIFIIGGSIGLMLILIPQLLKKARGERDITAKESEAPNNVPVSPAYLEELKRVVERLEYDVKERDTIIARLNANNDTLESAVRQAIAEERERVAKVAIAAEHARMAGDTSFVDELA